MDPNDTASRNSSNCPRLTNFAVPQQKVVTRAARALIGWMTPEDARRYSTNHNMGGFMSEAQEIHAERARQFVAARKKISCFSSDVISEVDVGLDEYVARFMAQPEFDVYRREGWVVRMADLRRVCALQHRVFWDYAVQRTAAAIPADPISIAQVTLPLATEPPSLPIQIEEQNERWLVASDNPNLQVVGHFSDKTDVGNGRKLLTLGFFVSVEPSYLQVIRHRDRYLLRDGYHRALGLLSAGISHAPVLTREYADYAPLGFDRGNVSQMIFLGDTPPFLVDYLDNNVSSEVHLSADRYLITVDVNKICLGI